ncbi:beta-lactamase class D [Maribacter dokdonensis]|uniref:Beta-lactamase n=1 Tax=Maribacter dokdonensis TaxID=320912 RepID=A0ABY0UMK4_9FLAO|nr:class D beta-lactamase [Maribacter dokdonensis]SDS91580.1 beta-lactamase class D [Maribacter dokdonensis]
MKITLMVMLLILCFSCKEKKESLNDKTIIVPVSNKIYEEEFQVIIDSSDVKGAILIYDLKKDMYYSNDFDWANHGNLPASTFKIANSIIGLEIGVIESETTVFKWDGKKKWLKNWEQDLVLKNAFQFSCVPCYQEVARGIGVKRMNDYVEKLNYGNLNIDSTNIDNFWLAGKSRISQVQQIDFLKRLYTLELPISKRTDKIMRNIMLMEEIDQYKLYGKSGLSNDEGNYNGWFVGFIEVKNNPYFFATNLEPKQGFIIDSFIKKRLDLTLTAFTRLNILN